MKKIMVVLAAVLVAAALTGCKSNDFTTAEVGWANYAEITVKDFNTVGIVTVEAVEETITAPFGLSIEHKGKRVTYSDLMDQAKALGADDIINVRIDKHTEGKTSPFDWLTGSQTKVTYTGTALAIKYKSVEKDQEIDANNRTVSAQSSGSGLGGGGFSLKSILPF